MRRLIDTGNPMADVGEPGFPTLASLTRPEVNGLWFNGKVISLDGYRFVDCRFDRCRLTVNSLNFELLRCFIDNETVIEYGAMAIKPIQLFTSRMPYFYEHMPGFTPRRDVNNTITIAP